jgi:putative two-component system response regulator
MNTHPHKISDTDIAFGCILIVDDEEANIKLMERLLLAQGYNNTLSIRDPREVMAICKKHVIDLILLDLNMPQLDGYAVMHQLFNEFGHDTPPILVVTAQVSAEFKKKAFDAGARDYITKPFDVNEVIARTRNLLETKMLHDRLRKQNEILELKVTERTHEIYSTRLQVVRRLGRAAEYRDNETGLHIVRMSKISQLLGNACGLNTYLCDLLLNASPMHDIGKIGIPDSILLKPGKLDPQEWDIMKTHTLIGGNILSGDDSELLVMAREIALTHHEKWDGSGYPGQLRGDTIPLVGRIVAVADVFDALTSERPYKKAWSIDDAVDFMNKQQGLHFDPYVIRQFNQILGEIIEVKETHAEPEHIL